MGLIRCRQDVTAACFGLGETGRFGGGCPSFLDTGGRLWTQGLARGADRCDDLWVDSQRSFAWLPAWSRCHVA